MADSGPNELDQLRRENARLIALLEAHGVAWRSSGPGPITTAARIGRDHRQRALRLYAGLRQ